MKTPSGIGGMAISSVIMRLGRVVRGEYLAGSTVSLTPHFTGWVIGPFDRTFRAQGRPSARWMGIVGSSVGFVIPKVRIPFGVGRSEASDLDISPPHLLQDLAELWGFWGSTEFPQQGISAGQAIISGSTSPISGSPNAHALRRDLVNPSGADPRFISQMSDGSQPLDEKRASQGDENLRLALSLHPAKERDAAPHQQTPLE